MEYDNLPTKTQDKIEEILWSKCNSTKEVCMGLVNDWLTDHGDDGWDADRWIEEAGNASI